VFLVRCLGKLKQGKPYMKTGQSRIRDTLFGEFRRKLQFRANHCPSGQNCLAGGSGDPQTPFWKYGPQTDRS
jgi:hypothetical protein